MITADKNHLSVIQDLRIDRSLPKYQQKHQAEENESSTDGFTMARSVIWNSTEDRFDIVEVPVPKSPGFWSRLAFWRKSKPETKPALSIEEFFTKVKTTKQQLTCIEERAKGYEIALKKAHQTGQKALLEQLTQGLECYRLETYLVSIGLTQWVSEEDIVKFYKQSPKGLRLDYVGNYTRIIPNPIVVKMEQANQLGCFDNYCILHYDPGAKSWAETQAEKDHRRDPILFGLIRGSTKLYFVGDWVDELCDLTLEQVAEALGKGSVRDLSTPG